MKALRIMGYYFALLVMILPWRAQAADADDFVTANRSQQARLLEQWAAAPQAQRLPLLRALAAETLQVDSSGHAFSNQQALGRGGGTFRQPQTGAAHQPPAQPGRRRAGHGTCW
ncbi:Branched-chain amino acid ABC-type transport system, permease components [Raoultella terrigena]|uniref:Branched-chain amino acid ABC-type transport system, permease components n=1 Tax=Raoultella terrigena TaxID=577 RepID=A0A4U9CTF5_RAOTE|nr:Branched-chain amino acid ABC-type transport system, permease components [Raoultella terrigena]